MTVEATPEDTGAMIPPSAAQHLLDGVELPTDTIEDRIVELLAGPLGGRAQVSDLASCLPALLAALGWNGVPRQLLEALPSDESTFELTDMTNTLIRLGFIAQRRTVRCRDIASAGPALWLRRGKPAVVVLDYSDLGALIYDPVEGKQRSIELPRGKADVLQFIDVRADSVSSAPAAGAGVSWFRTVFDAFRGLVSGALALSFIVNVLALAMPLFVMAVYDRIIATGDRSGIWFLVGGVGIAIVCDLALRHLRMRMQILVGARLNYLVGSRIVEHMLGLPLALLKRAGVTAQVARIRDLERIRSVIAGPLATSMLEFPVLLVFIVAIAMVGGWMAVVPAAAAVVLMLAAAVYNRAIDRQSGSSALAGVQRQTLIVEALDKMRAIRVTGAEAVYRRRFADLSEVSAATNFGYAKTVALAQSFAQCTLMVSMLCLLGLGVGQVLDGALTAGGLIAVMMLGWRVQGPMQSAFVASTRLFQLRSSIRQIDSLMALPAERPVDVEGTAITGVAGRVTLDMVTFRSAPEHMPVVMNVSVDIQPGELIAVTGTNGVGNSALLELIAGLHHPQGGAVRIDGRDLRQFDPFELRQVLAYAPHAPELFDGTIAENLRLAAPTADDAMLEEALDLAGVRDLVMALPDGLNTRIDSSGSGRLPTSLLGQLSLARAYARRAPIMLLDEPVGGFDFEGEFAFVDGLNRLRGKTTIILVTYRPSHIRLADKVLVMKDGTSRYFGPPEQVIEKITEAFSKEGIREISA